MPIPISLLQAEQSNMYELTCAAIRRASQLAQMDSRIRDIENTEESKIVPRAIEHILTRSIQYRIED